MPAVTVVLLDFQLSTSTQDVYLVANGLRETDGSGPYHPDHSDDYISKLPFSKMGETGDKRTIVLYSVTCGLHHILWIDTSCMGFRDGDLSDEITRSLIAPR